MVLASKVTGPGKREPAYLCNPRWANFGAARIVYCHTLPVNTFALGLQFLVRTGEWTTQT